MVGWLAGGLSAIALSVAVLPALMHLSLGPQDAYGYLSVAAAIILGHFMLAMRARHRAELAEWMDSLQASHQALVGALAQSATIMAERESAERRLREGEEMLRKVFDAAPDNIVINRMSDGATLEVNRQFLKTGYTREEVLGVSTAKIGRWPPDQLRMLIGELRARGTVRNFETELRNKDGRLVPSLIAATLVELGGEQCVISMSRDIGELKRTERELRAAREALSAEVHQLEASQATLRSEIAERELAQRRLRESEQTLRRILDTSLDYMTIRRLSDGRYIEVNKAFEAVCYTRDEALGKTAEELGLWVDPAKFRLYYERLKAEGQVRNMEFEFRARDGRCIPGLVSAVVVELGGEPCVVSMARDISRLKQTERELIAAREAALAALEAKSHFLDSSAWRAPTLTWSS
jgi:PAS domain S-box-containing protein